MCSSGANHTLEQIRDFIEADAVVYQSLADLKAVYREVAGCFACFSGVYPTGVGEETMGVIEAERELRQSERVNYGALAGGGRVDECTTHACRHSLLTGIIRQPGWDLFPSES